MLLLLHLLIFVAQAFGKSKKEREIVIATFPDEQEVDFYKTDLPPLPKSEKVLLNIPPEKILNKKKSSLKASKASKKQPTTPSSKNDVSDTKSKSFKGRMDENFEIVEDEIDPSVVIEAEDVHPLPEAKIAATSSCSFCHHNDVKPIKLLAQSGTPTSNTGKVQAIARPDLKADSSSCPISYHQSFFIVSLIAGVFISI